MFALRTDHFELSSRGFIATGLYTTRYVGEREENRDGKEKRKKDFLFDSAGHVRAFEHLPLSFAAASSFFFSLFVSGPSLSLSLSLFLSVFVYIVLRDV